MTGFLFQRRKLQLSLYATENILKFTKINDSPLIFYFLSKKWRSFVHRRVLTLILFWVRQFSKENYYDFQNNKLRQQMKGR